MADAESIVENAEVDSRQTPDGDSDPKQTEVTAQMADKTNTEATVTEAPTETAETTIEEVSSTSDEKEEKTEARQSSATNGSGDKEDDSQEKQGSKEENVAKVEENIVSQENVQENESQDKTETTEQPSSRKSTPPKITVASAEQGLTSVAATDSEVIQSSAQTNSENDSTAVATDEKKSDPDKETVLPDASGSVVNKEDSKRPATEPARKKKKEKKSKRRSRHSSESGAAVPKLSRKTSKSASTMSPAGLGGKRCLEAIIIATFQLSDEQGTGNLEENAFWEILRSTLALDGDEIAALQTTVQSDRSGQISYIEFASRATDILANVYTNQPASEKHWVELQMPDGTLLINYNKMTGEAMDKMQAGNSFFAAIIDDLYRQAEKDENDCISWEMFQRLLDSAEMSPFLEEQDYQDLYAYFVNLPDGKASYNEFYGLVGEAILRVYRAKDPSESPWCKVSSAEVGEVWFNKNTGESFQGIQVDGSEREIEWLSQAYAQVEQTSFQLEQYKELNKQLENRMALSAEDQEVLETQLLETGQALDQANNVIIEKENEIMQLNDVISRKDHEIGTQQGTISELDAIKHKMKELELELQQARETIANRDNSITERDTNIMAMQQKEESVKDTLKNAQGRMDARDSTIARLEHQIKVEHKKLKDYEDLVPELEEKLSDTTKQLTTNKKLLDERTSLLHLTKKHLKVAREKNMEMDKEFEKIGQVHEKLRNMDSEIRTLKTLLTTKTAMIEKNKKELREERQVVADLQEKDRRRAVILADVLEKTARQYQKHLGGGKKSVQRSQSPSRSHAMDVQGGPDEPRPYSAPAIPPEGDSVDQTDQASPRLVKTYTTDTQGPVLAYSSGNRADQRVQVREPARVKMKVRSRTVPKLPLIRAHGPRQQRTKTFVFPTHHDMRRFYKVKDASLLDHCPSNPYCRCEMCVMNSTVVGQPKLSRPGTHITGMTGRTAGLHTYQGETDVREVALSQQLHIGQRVVVKMKRSEFDLEPTKLTGVVRYVGKIDSEYVDHRYYVGVKLDEAVGDTDGLIKNKRYFTCPPRHGKFVRINNVVAILPNQGMKYKSLQDASKRSPYGAGPAQKAPKNNSDIKVS